MAKVKQKPKFSKTLLVLIVLAVTIPGAYLVYRSFAMISVDHCKFLSMQTRKDSETSEVYKLALSYNGDTSVQNNVTIDWGDGTQTTSQPAFQLGKTHSYLKSPRVLQFVVTIKGTCKLTYKKSCEEKRTISIPAKAR